MLLKYNKILLYSHNYIFSKISTKEQVIIKKTTFEIKISPKTFLSKFCYKDTRRNI